MFYSLWLKQIWLIFLIIFPLGSFLLIHFYTTENGKMEKSHKSEKSLPWCKQILFNLILENVDK